MSIARRLRQWTNVQVLRSPNTDRQHDALKLAGLTLPVAVPEQWVVDGKCVGDGGKALLYLSRYLYRGVIQEGDILRCEDGKVSFQYRDAKTAKMGVRTLDGADFLWLWCCSTCCPRACGARATSASFTPTARGRSVCCSCCTCAPRRPPRLCRCQHGQPGNAPVASPCT